MTLPWHLVDNSQINFNIARVKKYVDFAALFIARFLLQ